MTLSRSFVNFLEDKGYGVFGQEIFLFRVPNSMKTKTEVLWVVPSGGVPVSKNKTGELIKAYNFLIRFRSQSAERVDKILSALEDTLNCTHCVELEGYELVSVSATQFPTSQDLDSEDRMVGYIQAQLEVYKRCGIEES